jgi:hypothetical protein
MEKVYQSETIAELAKALAAAQGEMGHATKDVSNTFFKSKYADLPAVIDAARPALAKNGLAVVQVTEFDEQGNVGLMTQLMHSSGQWVRGWYPIRPVKNDPQGIGSALTYARRYSYQGMAGIASAADDDDGNAASGNAPGASNKPEVSDWTQKKPSARARNAEWTRIRDELIGCGSLDELKMIWSANYTKVEEFRRQDAQFAEELERVKDTRKAELSGQKVQDEAMTAGMPAEFNQTK